MKKLIILISIISTLLITTSCSYFNSTAINVGYGKDTMFGNLSKAGEERSYSINDVSVEFIRDYDVWSTSLELSLINHEYKYKKPDMLTQATSLTTKVWLIRNFKYDDINLFAGAGVGMGYINPTNDNKYLANTHVISDLGIRVGIQKTFEWFNLRLEYMFRHFSGIWEDDSGENEDEVRIGVVIPLGRR